MELNYQYENLKKKGPKQKRRGIGWGETIGPNEMKQALVLKVRWAPKQRMDQHGITKWSNPRPAKHKHTPKTETERCRSMRRWWCAAGGLGRRVLSSSTPAVASHARPLPLPLIPKSPSFTVPFSLSCRRHHSLQGFFHPAFASSPFRPPVSFRLV